MTISPFTTFFFVTTVVVVFLTVFEAPTTLFALAVPGDFLVMVVAVEVFSVGDFFVIVNGFLVPTALKVDVFDAVVVDGDLA
jgi:hypothetical protein